MSQPDKARQYAEVLGQLIPLDQARQVRAWLAETGGVIFLDLWERYGRERILAAFSHQTLTVEQFRHEQGQNFAAQLMVDMPAALDISIANPTTDVESNVPAPPRPKLGYVSQIIQRAKKYLDYAKIGKAS